MKVSILIPCHNAERWIGQAVESALSQDYEDKEVLVVDDGSTDRSGQILREFGDKIMVEFTGNRGGNAARNRLIDMSGGTWLQFLDADDYLLPGKISSQVADLGPQPDCDVIYGPVWLRNEDQPQDQISLIEIPRPHDPWILLARWFLPQTGAPLWNRAALMDVGGWNENQKVCQDHELYLRLLIAGKKLVYSSASGAVYRVWSEQTLCRRDKRETYAERIRIVEEAERFLLQSNQMNTERLDAINQTRFICARIIWQWDRSFARSLITDVFRSDPKFSPDPATVPRAYSFLFALLGFSAAEKIAEMTRAWRNASPAQS